MHVVDDQVFRNVFNQSSVIVLTVNSCIKCTISIKTINYSYSSNHRSNCMVCLSRKQCFCLFHSVKDIEINKSVAAWSNDLIVG